MGVTEFFKYHNIIVLDIMVLFSVSELNYVHVIFSITGTAVMIIHSKNFKKLTERTHSVWNETSGSGDEIPKRTVTLAIMHSFFWGKEVQEEEDICSEYRGSSSSTL